MPTENAKRAHHRTSTPHGTPYNIGTNCNAGQWSYCLAFAEGDSITVPVHIYSTYVQGTPPCSNDYSWQESINPTPWPSPWAVSVSPESSEINHCWWATTVYVTMSLNGYYIPGGGWGSGSIFWDQPGLNYPTDYSTIEGYLVEATPSHPPATPPPTPTPGVDIFDFNLHAIVTGTSQYSVGGVQQVMQAVPSEPNVTLGNCNWTIGGNIVGGYAPSGPSPSPAATSDALEVLFYWIGSGNNSTNVTETVSVTCSVSGGGNLSATASYHVQQPLISPGSGLPVVTEYGSTVTGYEGGFLGNSGIYIAYASGPSPSPQPGVGWSFIAESVPTPGQIALLQTLYYDNTAIIPSPRPTTTTLATSNGLYCVDASPTPFLAPAATIPSPVVATDAPAQPIYTPITSASLDMAAKDFYMYEPKNDTTGGSIWITLASSAWHFITTATYHQPPSEPWSFSDTSVGGAEPSADSTLPTWSCIVQEQARKHRLILHRGKSRGKHNALFSGSNNVSRP
jgi:hypothetical protein